MQIFVSYVRDDEQFARRLVENLRKRGARVWFDLTDIVPEDAAAWEAWTQEALQVADALLLILSPAALQERYIEDDFVRFRDARRPVVAALAEPCQLPEGFGPFVDFRLNYDAALHRLQLLLIEEFARLNTQSKFNHEPDE